MRPAILTLFLVLTVGNLVYCQDWRNIFFTKMDAVLEKQEAALTQLKEMQEKQEHIEGKLQELHHEMEHLKGIHQETRGCLRREDLEEFKILSLADIDECTQGKAECSPLATCKNSIGSYSCSCNPPFEGDGRTCEFPCESPAKFFEGLGCIKRVEERKTWQQMLATCQEAGGRLLEDVTLRDLQDVAKAFPDHGFIGVFTIGWVGVYEGKWLESGTPLEEEFWMECCSTDLLGPCGGIRANSSSNALFRVKQYDCSLETWGYCQFNV